MSIVLKRLKLYPFCSQFLNQAFGYKSVYNIENLYPANKDLFHAYSSHPIDTTSEKFNGYVPIKKVTIKYSKSSGPGGQHANKTETKAEVRFHVMTADWIPEHLRSVILTKYRKRINKAGELIVWNEDSRYQMTNVKNCLNQIVEFIREAEKPPDTSKEERIAQLNNMESIQESHMRRLRKKKIRSYTKAMRNTFE